MPSLANLHPQGALWNRISIANCRFPYVSLPCKPRLAEISWVFLSNKTPSLLISWNERSQYETLHRRLKPANSGRFGFSDMRICSPGNATWTQWDEKAGFPHPYSTVLMLMWDNNSLSQVNFSSVRSRKNSLHGKRGRGENGEIKATLIWILMKTLSIAIHVPARSVFF